MFFLNSNNFLIFFHSIIILTEVLSETKLCRKPLDLIVVIDGSGSVRIENFIKAKDFAKNLNERMDLSDFGLIVFSDDSKIIIPLNSGLNKTDINNIIDSTDYPGGSTETNSAILTSIAMFENSLKKINAKQFLLLITDGNSNNGVKEAVGELSKTEIIPLVIAIGYDINNDELKEITSNETKHIFSLESFDDLKEYLDLIVSDICKDVLPNITTTTERPEITEYRKLSTERTTISSKIISSAITTKKAEKSGQYFFYFYLIFL